MYSKKLHEYTDTDVNNKNKYIYATKKKEIHYARTYLVVPSSLTLLDLKTKLLFNGNYLIGVILAKPECAKQKLDFKKAMQRCGFTKFS